MKILNDPQRDSKKYYGVVSVKNSGRRPVYLSHVCIDLPRKYIDKHGHFLLTEGVTGKTYNEGDPPKQFTVDQDLYLEKVSDIVSSDPGVLKRLRATVTAGNMVFKSRYAKEQPKKKLTSTRSTPVPTALAGHPHAARVSAAGVVVSCKRNT